MTEQDRGAYTPQTEAPLAFDARQSRGGGRPAPLTLIISGIVLMLLVIAILIFYRHGARHSGQPPQVVGAPVGQTRSAPTEAAPSDQAAGLQVYKSEVAPAAETPPAPAFVQPPEQPHPLPAPKTPPPAPAPVAVVSLRPAISPTPPAAATALPIAAPAAAKPKPVVKLATVAPAAAGAHPASTSVKPAVKLATASPPPVAATPKPAAAQDEIANLASAGASPAKPVTAEPKPKPKPKPAATAGGPAMVQIGAFSSSALADKGWQDATRAVPISGKTKAVEEVQKDGKTFYRTSVAGFASRADAASYCTALKATGHSCFVK
jgi:hypothetical protein